MKLWTFNADQTSKLTAPIETSCHDLKVGWPNEDDDGRTMFENTHFRTEEKAWSALIKNADAGQSMHASMYRQAQSKLHNATAVLAEASAFASEVREAFAARVRTKEKDRG